MTETNEYPVIDLHCDLLSYLVTAEGARHDRTEDIGCATPFLAEGNVKLQVLASYVPTDANSTALASSQYRLMNQLLQEPDGKLARVTDCATAEAVLASARTGVVAAVENASALCSESEPLDLALSRLDEIIQETGRVLYITLTHHLANRFGGGNQTTEGLKDDGRVLLDYIDGKRIAIDLSHTSDQLARGILDHIDGRGLDVPILASHSNFRAVHDHARNLPDGLALEIVNRGGVIGMNFVRAFVHPDDPSYLERHIQYGLEIGAGAALCFGADFFHWKGHPDPSRVPYYHEGQEHAGRYPSILESLDLTHDQRAGLAWGNALEFLGRLWT
jgi:microsomal dipeptidase-like Zn-dependent dipeptidase